MKTPAAVLAEVFHLSESPVWAPRYNIAPTQLAPTILRTPEDSDRQFRVCRWGLIPPWAKDQSIGGRLINARAETVATKPAFRAAFRQRRCLVPADGFYEWKQGGRPRQPLYIRMRDGRPFAFSAPSTTGCR